VSTTTEDEMSSDEVRAALAACVDPLVARGDFSRFFTEDVQASIVGTPQRATGPDAVEQMIRFMHEVAFDARPEPKNMLVDEGKAALEADFVGVHIGEFAGIAATQNSVRVPYSVIYDLDGDRIKALRIYMPLRTCWPSLARRWPARRPALRRNAEACCGLPAPRRRPSFTHRPCRSSRVVMVVSRGASPLHSALQ
jgi:predicted ester cyclase